MICLEIKCDSHEKMAETREKFHKALPCSPAYVNSEIAIIGASEASFCLVIGNTNDQDLHMGVSEASLMKTGKEIALASAPIMMSVDVPDEYLFEVSELSARIVSVKANSAEEACRKIKHAYNDGTLEFNADNSLHDLEMKQLQDNELVDVDNLPNFIELK